MNVKRYIAKDVQEAMQKIRMELGRDAVILHTRKIKQKGFRFWFKKPLVEVVAAVEGQEQVAKSANHASVANDQYLREATQALLQEKAREREAERSKAVEVDFDKQEIASLKQQMSILTELVQSVFTKPEIVKALAEESSSSTSPSPSPSPSDTLESMTHAPNPREAEPVIQTDPEQKGSDAETRYIKYLKSKALSDEAVSKILVALKRQLSLVETNEVAINTAVRGIIRDLIGSPYRIDEGDSKPKVYYFVGPTGVGKTTTLAKIAAKLSLVDGKKVGLVTSDTYRIAAVDQLKTYSEILSMPLEVIYEANELENVLKKFNEKDYVLIDTAGRNHKSPELHEDLSQLMSYTNNADVFLVISLTTGLNDIESILNSYAFLNDYKFIFTKLDEASSCGNILNTRVLGNKPIAFVTNGQSVPDDIAVSDGDKIASWLVGE